MTQSTQTQKRWLLPLLFVSLAANLLIVGIIVGWALSDAGPKRSELGAARGLVGEPFIRALPEVHRRALMRGVMRESEQVRESRENLRLRFEEFLTALRTEPFDPGKVVVLLDDQRSASLRRQHIGERLLLERLEAMSPQERQAYATALERSFKRLRRPAD